MIFKELFLFNNNNLYTLIWYQVFLSDTNNLHNYMVSCFPI